MNRYPRHTLPSQDSIPGGARVALYVVAIVAPFGALAAGRLTGEETVAAVVALFGVIGPAVAIGYQKKQADEDGTQFRAGYASAIAEHIAPIVETPQAGEHRGIDTTSGNTGDPLDGPHNGRNPA